MPLISIVTPVFNTPSRFLRACIESVLSQTFSDWEMILVDDHSTSLATKLTLWRLARRDSRIRLIRRQSNGGIVAASNDGLSLATGSLVAFLDHDDVLDSEALHHVVDTFLGDEDVDIVYTDEDLLFPDGTFREPFLKPDWSPERFRCQMYVCHFLALRTSLVEEIGGFRSGFDGSQDYDLVLRASEKARRIHHIPKVLYHWRLSPTSVAGNPDAKPYAYEAGEKAIRDHLARIGIDAHVERDRNFPGNYLVVRRKLPDTPRIALVTNQPFPVLNVYGVEVDAEQFLNDQIASLPFQPASVHTRDEWIDKVLLNDQRLRNNSSLTLFLDAGVEFQDKDWLKSLAAYFEEPDVVGVIPYLWNQYSLLHHAGYEIVQGKIEHHYRGLPRGQAGFRAVKATSHEISASELHCALFRSFSLDSRFADLLQDRSRTSTFRATQTLTNSSQRLIATCQANGTIFDRGILVPPA